MVMAYNTIMTGRVRVDKHNLFNLRVIEANNINTFKNALDKYWYDKKFNTPFT